MMHTPAQHNTTHPAGQQVNPVGTLLKEIEEFKRHTDGCCHKTVTEMCPTCPFNTLKRNEKGNPI